LNLSFQHYYKIGSLPEHYNLSNHFTLLGGPIFRKIKDDKTSISFGLDAGLLNTEYGAKHKDDFTLRIRVGIPFNVYQK
jgi:hypothetical protein